MTRRRFPIKLSSLFLLLILCLAAGLLSWPLILNTQSNSSYQAKFKTLTAAQEQVSSQTSDYGELYQYLKQYNEDIRSHKITGINDPWGFTDIESQFANTGLGEGLIGRVRIPKMEVDLPLYLGSDEANLLKGATLTYGTTAPLGEKNSNSVIAAHRGYRGGYMFNYIERLQLGDPVYLETPWAKMTYKVIGFKMVRPDEADAIKIEEGKNLITLLTCHPHPQHTHRLLVYCELSEIEDLKSQQHTTYQTDASTLTIDKHVEHPDNEYLFLGLDVLEWQSIITRLGLTLVAIFIALIIYKDLRTWSKSRHLPLS